MNKSALLNEKWMFCLFVSWLKQLICHLHTMWSLIALFTSEAFFVVVSSHWMSFFFHLLIQQMVKVIYDMYPSSNLPRLVNMFCLYSRSVLHPRKKSQCVDFSYSVFLNCFVLSLPMIQIEASLVWLLYKVQLWPIPLACSPWHKKASRPSFSSKGAERFVDFLSLTAEEQQLQQHYKVLLELDLNSSRVVFFVLR